MSEYEEETQNEQTNQNKDDKKFESILDEDNELKIG